ncbi:MAG: hypothetical protein HUJ74_04395 [Lachnospiraceae bacterium]|nr:hypothetical protein [Lachnospiraceae bacterium]MCF0129303.1 hypothetical protein [Pseudobutyrivibrio sp.]
MDRRYYRDYVNGFFYSENLDRELYETSRYGGLNRCLYLAFHSEKNISKCKMPDDNNHDMYFEIADFIRQNLFRGLDQNAFDCGHHKVVEKIIGIMGRQGCEITYGQAQYILNMTLKYAYCMGAIEKADRIQLELYGHTVLDSDMWPWCREETVKRCAKGEGTLIKKNISDWKKLEYEDYVRITSWMRGYFKEQKRSPFLESFVFGPKQQAKKACVEMEKILYYSHIPELFDKEDKTILWAVGNRMLFDGNKC